MQLNVCCTKFTLACTLLLLIVQNTPIRAANDLIGQQQGDAGYIKEIPREQPSLDLVESSDQLERRNGGYETGGGKTQVAISLQRVKNPDAYEKKKFPITWLRNQYPFNSYYKKKKSKSNYGKPEKYKNDPLLGQYSTDNAEFLDPNPSTWVRIPDRPTASIKFQKQPSYDFEKSLQPPPSLQFSPTEPMLMPLEASMGLQPFVPPGGPPINFNPQVPMQGHIMQAPINRAPNQVPSLARPSSSGLQTSESQNEYSSAPAAQKEEPQTGFGGISLSFGNGRSISFGGGQGLTIGGRAGAISIGGKNGGDNTAAASGYSETTKGGGASYGPATKSQPSSSYGGGAGSGYTSSGSSSYGSNSYGDSYVNKHPTMSVDVPRKGKTIMHANLDMAPLKVRLHSSPRVKITTGSRDPLEKPGDEELTENEEDIFEPPEPFPKKNATSTDGMTNGTSTTNGTETTTLSPMQLQEMQLQNGRYPQGYNQETFSQYQQQVPFDDHVPQIGQVGTNQPYNNNHIPPNQPYHHSQSQFTGVNQQPYRPLPQPNNQQHPGQFANQGYNAQVPFDEPPYLPQQQHPEQFIQQQHVAGLEAQNNQRGFMNHLQQQHLQQQQPPQQATHYPPPPSQYRRAPGPEAQLAQQPMRHQPIEQPPTPVNPMMQQPQQMPIQNPPSMQAIEGQRAGVDHWRQFSREARQQMNLVVPKQQDLTIDNNPRFYNGRNHPNSIVETQLPPVNQQQPTQRFENEGKEMVDVAASSNVGSFAKANQSKRPVALNQLEAPRFPVTQTAVGLTSNNQQLSQGLIPSSNSGLHQANKLSSHVPQAAESKAYPGKPIDVQSQASNYQSSTYQQQQSSYGKSSNSYSSYGNEPPSKTYTLGSGGLSTHYGNGGGYESGSSSSDGFDQKHYAAKVEKFDPDAHDKRERTKVVLFLKPRISIHMANSSTTTKRPKNAQRLLYVINRPIFLNSTNMTHHDEEFIDPDLKEPMEIGYGHNYGYGYGYTQGYRTKNSTTTTTKKPKTTTTTTTTVAPESESTTSSASTSGESEGTTQSPTTTTESSTTTTSTETPSSSSASSGSSDDTSDSSKTTSEATSTEGTTEPSSISSSSTTETSEDSSSTLNPDVSIIDIKETTEQEGSSEAPESTSETTASSSATDDQAADLVASATEPTSTTTTTTTTMATKSTRPTRLSAPPKSTTTQKSPSTTTTTTTTTTPEPTTTTSTEAAPTETEVPQTTTTTEVATTTTDAPSTTEAIPSTDDSKIQSQAKRSTKQEFRNLQASRQQQPMLLTPELIDKLMSNKTLVSLMSSQLKRVIDTENMNEDEKQRVVRQVFDQMMEDKVDFSMNNVRLAVKTVSSSYQAAAQKQRLRSSSSSTASSNNLNVVSLESKRGKQQQKGSSRMPKTDLKGFGRRAVTAQSSTTETKELKSNQSSEGKSSSKSFPVIDTALKLTKGAQTTNASGSNTSGSKSQRSASTSNGNKMDASGNPIVVVLLPQEKA